ncbi:MAG: ATP-dependent 6-phosphofructokinase [Lachnospiraceae bacterium]|nr:ATP-dependent 6-phosphofructokinase [Lachnospiraceae bacterium]
MLPADDTDEIKKPKGRGTKTVKTIGIMTSGEDAPGMNAAIRAVVRSAIGYDMKVWGIYRGYAGLLEKDALEMSNKTMSETVQKGGTLLLAADSPEIHTKEGREKTVKCIKEMGIDALVVIGNNDSLKVAGELANLGVNVVGIPATIDLDVACTEYTVGFDTAVNTAMRAIDKIRDTSASHERCSIIEVAGERSAYNALWCGIANGAEDVVTERGSDRDEQRIISDIISKKRLGKKLHLIVNSESVGHSKSLAKNIEFATGLEARATILGQLQRGGTPSCMDRVFASSMGGKAVEVLRAGGSNRIIAYDNGEFVDFDIKEALGMTKSLDSYMVALARKLSRKYTDEE